MNLIILAYHKICDTHDDKQKHSISLAAFDAQMKILADVGYVTTTMSKMEEIKQAGETQSDHRILISFDDGYKSDYEHAFQILKKYGLRAVFFVSTGKIGEKGYLSWQDIVQMSRHGMSIQSHSVSHRFLDVMTNTEIEFELKHSKEDIEQRIGRKINYISLPFGFGSKRIKAIAETSGYTGIMNSQPGVNYINEIKFQELNRNMITRNTTLNEFKGIIDGDKNYYLKKRMIYLPKYIMRKVIGSRNYYRLYEKISKYSC